jgi:hypothetical protein
MTDALRSFGTTAPNFLMLISPGDTPAISRGTFLDHRRLFVAIAASYDRGELTIGKAAVG